MSTTATPLHNALDSLDRVARELEQTQPDDAMGLKGPLAWGWHAVGLLAYQRLGSRRETFDAWLQDYLPEGEPPLEVDRDARWEERQRLSFFELLDIMSEEKLPLLKPEFYQGWQDRTSRCHGIRRQLAQLVGGSIGEAQRERLLLLLAAYHRLIRLPAGVALEPGSVRTALPALLDLAALLLDWNAPEAGELEAGLERCRAALGEQA